MLFTPGLRRYRIPDESNSTPKSRPHDTPSDAADEQEAMRGLGGSAVMATPVRPTGVHTFIQKPGDPSTWQAIDCNGVVTAEWQPDVDPESENESEAMATEEAKEMRNLLYSEEED
mmetsp:Transcript_14123/g.24831  ORF Transcript_14123/g.24831 Transcript_14123/m.24831 type:complete len:116 (+) Transcript_14123:50-397(+)